MKFSIKYFFSKFYRNPQFPADLVTFSEEILNGKLYFSCSKNVKQSAVSDHLPEWRWSIDFNHFDIPGSDAEKRLLIMEILFIKRDQSQSSKTTKFILLKLFDWDICW